MEWVIKMLNEKTMLLTKAYMYNNQSVIVAKIQKVKKIKIRK